jgi:hypothetical protein
MLCTVCALASGSMCKCTLVGTVSVGQVRSGQVGQLRPTARRFRSQGGLRLARRCSTQGRCEWAARARAGAYGRGAGLLRKGRGRTVPAGRGWKPGLGHRPGLGFKLLPSAFCPSLDAGWRPEPAPTHPQLRGGEADSEARKPAWAARFGPTRCRDSGLRVTESDRPE